MTVNDLDCASGPLNDSWFDDKVTVCLSNIDLTVNSATLSGIAEFVVDDMVSPPLPADVSIFFILCYLFVLLLE